MLNFRSSVLPLTVLLAVGAVARLSAQNDLDVPANTKVTLNESAAYQNITVGTGATLETIDANSGGGGDHAITVTFAASGAGTIQNDGTIELFGNDQGNTTVFANPVTLSGSGTLELLNTYGFNDASVQGPGTVTQTAGHTLIGGGGDTGATGPGFSAPLVNNGLVTTSNLGFVLNGASLINNGTFSASNGAALSLDAPTLDNTNGIVTAADTSSLVILNGITITGGTLSSVNDTGSDFDTGGYFRNDSPATLNNVTLTAGSAFKVLNPITIVGILTNNGYFFLNGYNFNTGLTGGFTLAADATLAGTGIARLAGGEIDATNNATLTLAAGATIAGGSGTINASLVNNGTVESVYQAVTINSPTFTNNGVLAADNNAEVSISGSTNFTNYSAGTQTLTGGTYLVTDTGNGGTLDFGGRNVLVNAAEIILSGANTNFNAINGLTTNAGSFALLALNQFTDSASLTNTGTISLDVGTTLHVNGAYAGSGPSMLAVTVGGTASSGSQSPGVLQVNGAVSLGGTLAVTFATGATLPGAGDSLAIVSAGSPITGAFGNVASGARLTTTDGQGSFVITYAGANTVVLSDFVVSGASTLPAFFTGETALANGVYYLTFPSGNYFGYYSFLANPAYIFHFDLGFEYVFDAADGNSGVYFYDFASSDFFYTSPSFPFPYLYDFSLNTVLYYYPDPNNAGHYNTNGVRYFYDFASGQIISK